MKEISAGFIVFNKDRKVLLLLNSKGHWDFPKGHVEKSESLLEAAKRELKEEAGIIKINVLPLFQEKISYYYTEHGKKVFKEVYFFLAVAEESEVKISNEHTSYKWVECSQAVKMLSFENQKRVLMKACNHIKHYNSRL